MLVGIPKEIKTHEYQVAATPDGSPSAAILFTKNTTESSAMIAKKIALHQAGNARTSLD